MKPAIILFVAALFIITLPFALAVPAYPTTVPEKNFSAEEILGFVNDNCFDSAGKMLPPCSEFVKTLNEGDSAKNIPDIMISLFDNKKINLSIAGKGTEYLFYIETKDKKILKIEKRNASDAEIVVETDTGTITTIAESKNPVNAFADALAGGKIKYRETGIAGAIKTILFNVAAFFAGILRFFSSLIGK